MQYLCIVIIKTIVMNIQLTRNADIFDKYNVPTCNLTNIRDAVKFPRFLCFGETLYKYYNEKLVAFRILAYAVYSRLTTDKVGLSFLVQLPNSKPQWIEDFITEKTIIFDSKESFLAHQVCGNADTKLGWDIGRMVFPELSRAAVIGFYGRCWAWDKNENKPHNEFYPHFTHLLITDEGMLVYISKNTCGQFSDVFLSQEDCVKDRLNGMEIVEFADEPMEINIKIYPNAPKVHTLRFIEE